MTREELNNLKSFNLRWDLNLDASDVQKGLKCDSYGKGTASPATDNRIKRPHRLCCYTDPMLVNDQMCFLCKLFLKH